MEPILAVERLTKRYGDRDVLSDVSLHLPPGSVTLLTGRSGSGKSTLFKLLAALDRPTSGSIRLEGADLTTLDDEQLSELRLRRLGLVFQSFNLLHDLTALENVRLPLDLAGTKRKVADARARELLELVGLGQRLSARPNVMSGGEQQRVAVARALANSPVLVLADEPTGNLDRKNADAVFELFQNLNQTLGTTILIITHDDLAHDWFHRRMELHDGALEGGISHAETAQLTGASKPGPPNRRT